MRSSFGGSYGLGRSGGGGGGSDGGGMLRTMGRVVRRAGIHGTQDPISSSSSSSSSSSPTTKSSTKNFTQKSSASKHALSLSSSSSCNSNTNSNYNLLAFPPLPNYFSANDFSEFDDQWEHVDNYVGDCVDHVFGPVPSSYEVEQALFSLQQAIPPISSSSRFTNLETLSAIEKDASNATEKASSTSSDSDWIEPTMQIYNQRFPLSCGLDRVYDAFQLLQTEPSVQRLVMSLSSDKAVWDAILNNEAVREIRESYRNAEPSPRISDENSDLADTNPNVLKWIFDNMKVKLLEVIGAISQFLGEIFKPLDQDKTEHSDTFSEKLKSSFLLTIVVLLIVVVARGHKA